ncbi:hypothetical protein CL673_02870 [Candidatus Bathyarchaeota archaeon]|jgi:5-methyltetrahydrofolate--homocysteine methyltransferase|nr:hypothetical protein [Candidatus Bathyarchaeota archaeon]MDP6048785.1 cobalamin-dependent protein [Candidatus Bathyarchaeota archaeon]|tara:strand:+ start:10173 stop:10529 length:357 start_codon:yes stop_codon:yes gene_type:complete
MLTGKKHASAKSCLEGAGHIMKEATAILEPLLESGASKSKGVIVFATVEGDLNDLGKNIAIAMLKSVGLRVVDLCVDVTAADIVRVAEEEEADIVVLSALLSVLEPQVVKTINTLKRS